MNVILKFLDQYSYRFPKGYPDLTDFNDKKLMYEILDELSLPLYEILELDESAQDIKDELIAAGYDENDIVIKSSKQIRLLSKGSERKTTIDKLLQDLPDSKLDINFKGSSLGAIIANDGTAIIVKPKEKQGGRSAGLDNEESLVTSINEYTSEGPIEVVFEGNNQSISFNNVTLAKQVGADTAGGKKSDVALYSNNSVVGNLSLKKSNASMWESADRRYKALVNSLVTKLLNNEFPNVGLRSTEKEGIYRLFDPQTKTDISGVVINNLPDNENESIVFGTDEPKVQVIKHTFQPSDFSFNNGVLTIKAGTILSSLDDIEGTEYEPILVIRHDVTRTATKGLRPIVYNKNFAYKGDEIKGSLVPLDYSQVV
jgi:hypothetical protein